MKKNAQHAAPFEYAKHCDAKTLSRITSLTSAVIFLNKHPLQKKNAMHLAEKFKFTERQSAHLLGMSLRLYKLAAPSAVLHIPVVENVMRLSELYDLGLKTFDGNAQSFIKWLNANVGSLNNLKPIQVLFSGIGIEVVKNELLRMENAVQ